MRVSSYSCQRLVLVTRREEDILMQLGTIGKNHRHAFMLEDFNR